MKRSSFITLIDNLNKIENNDDNLQETLNSMLGAMFVDSFDNDEFELFKKISFKVYQEDRDYTIVNMGGQCFFQIIKLEGEFINHISQTPTNKYVPKPIFISGKPEKFAFETFDTKFQGSMRIVGKKENIAGRIEVAIYNSSQRRKVVIESKIEDGKSIWNCLESKSIAY